MSERSVNVRLTADVSDLVAKAGIAQKALNDIAGDRGLGAISKRKAAITDLSTGIGLVGAGLTAAGAAAVGFSANFDQKMSAVRAATRASISDMRALREEALKAGAETAFSASEAADGIEQLAKAGVSTAEILGGGLRGALDLAAAGEVDVAFAAETAASAMTQFGLKGDQVTHVADLLAAGASKAQGGVQDLANALEYAGLPAAGLGVSIEQTTGTLALFASAGLVGEKAGTSLRGMLASLSAPSQKAAEAMEELGIRVFDAQGNFIGMDGVAAVLQERLAGLSQEQRSAALGTIFGNEQLQAAQILYQGGAQAVEEWTKKVDDAGFAAEHAGILLDNLKGDLEALKGSLETALIGAGEGGQPMLRGLTQQATDLVNAFNELPGSAQSATLAIVGGGGLVLLGVAGMARLAVRVAETREAMDALGVSSGQVARILGRAALYTGIAIGLGEVRQAIADTRIDLDELGEDIIDLGRGKVGAEIEKSFGKDLQDLGANLEQALGGGYKILSALTPGFIDGISDIRNNIKSLDEALADLVQQGSADVAEDAFWQLRDAAKEQGVSLDQLRAAFPEYSDALERAAAGAEETATQTQRASGATGVYALQAEDATRALKEQRTAWRNAADAAKGYSDGILALRESQRGFEQALDDASDRLQRRRELLDEAREAQRRLQEADTPEERKAAREELERINAELETYRLTVDKGSDAGRENARALDAIADAGLRVIEDMRQRGFGEEAIRTQYGKSRKALENTAVQFGMTRKEARKYVDQVLKIPKSVSTEVEIKGLAESYGLAKQWEGVLDRLDGRQVSVVVGAINKLNAQLPGGADGGIVGETLKLRTVGLHGYAAGGILGPYDARGGGLITAGTGPRSDDVLFLGSRGERIVNARASAEWGDLLDAINAGQLRRYADGGLLGRGGPVTTTHHADVNYNGPITVIAHDYDDFRRQQERERRIATMRGGRG